ncbi:MAG: hypothetical protein A2Z18_00350 [Armatimonadetes bacterium RBG_16_58_9]|nr:MAG: hypothetical protein A2Z18_00350 [Armatimonadetes bacterium RBG_16_58_9]
MSRIRTITHIIGITLVVTLTGCAKFPDTPPVTGKQLVLTMTVRGKIEPVDGLDPGVARYYFIAIDNDGDDQTGPWAAVFPPYGGNGWVTSNDAQHSVGMTSFIEYDAANPDGYLYGVLPGSFFLNTTSPVPPIRTELLEGGSTLRFIVDFSQIATVSVPAADITSLDINFITTNALPVGGEFVPGREWDALGPSGQNYVNVDTTNDRLYFGDNSDGPVVTDPDLDIIYWSIEVQTVSSG